MNCATRDFRIGGDTSHRQHMPAYLHNNILVLTNSTVLTLGIMFQGAKVEIEAIAVIGDITDE